METVNYFRRNNTDVYVLLLDASQAFDQVNYVKLCQLLLNRNPLIRCLLYLYTNQYLNIRWNCCMSKYCSAFHGVNQCGVLSPILFRIYVDELLSIDELLMRNWSSVLWCSRLRWRCVVHFSFKTLSRNDVQYIFGICSGIWHTFNPMKCQFLYYGNNANVTFSFENVVLHAIKKGIHLGHVIGPNVNKKCSVGKCSKCSNP